jgi:signal peptidase
MKKILKITEWIIFIFLLGLLFIVLSPLLPTDKYIATYIVATGSMEPTIKTGSIVFSSKQKDIKQGDVIVFESPTDPDVTISHRVVDVVDEGYKTKGDNNNQADADLVSQEQMKGKVLLSIPYLGYAVEWMKTTTGFITLLVIPGLILAIFQFIKIREGINDEVEKRTTEELTKRNI